MTLETVLFVVMGLPFILWLACEFVNLQWLIRQKIRRWRKACKG